MRDRTPDWVADGIAYLESLSALSEHEKNIAVANGLRDALTDLKCHDDEYGTLYGAWGIAAAILHLGGMEVLREVSGQ